ncbi:MAG: serine/threonine protein kinase [Thermomicrobiales bacterium]|nr:serine/threonine protein kinase [Thermomicrobiales bacterium]
MDEKRDAHPPTAGDDAAPEVEPEQDSRDGPAGDKPAADPRTTIAGRYSVDLETPPTNAGIAVTYQGRDLRTRDAIMVKTLRLEYRGDPEMRARFRREARLLQFLTHPNVVRALTFVEERGAPWLVLERVPGRTLREEIAERAPFPPEEVVPILRGLAAALDHLHARGLAHLDVRPENAVITPEGDVKLIDFGVAQAAGTAQEPGDGGALDVAYLAPEQVCGEPVGPATDIYALGSIAYEMLTGRVPFPLGRDPASRNAAVRARLEQTPTPPTIASERRALPAWVDGVILEALARDPAQRYSSAGSFAAVYHSGVEGEVDVETGRPRLQESPPRPRQVPTNEPAIAVKGSPRLAARRAERHPVATPEPPIVDAAFSPRPLFAPAAQDAPRARRFGPTDLATLSRRLWQAVIIAAVLNLVLIGALVATRGELPLPWGRGQGITPGTTVQVAGSGLAARAAPAADAPVVAELADRGEVRIVGEPVAGEDGPWWPIEVTTPTGTISGYVPASWVRDQ